MKKNDFILILCIFIIAIAAFSAYRFIYSGEGVLVVITIDGKEFQSLDLNKDMIIDIPGAVGINRLEIKNGYVSMLSAHCPDQICVNHKRIHYGKEAIVCLPGKIVVEIRGGQALETDAYAY